MPIRKHSRKLSGGRRRSSGRKLSGGKVRTGPRGGKYVLRGGRKVYLSGGGGECRSFRKTKDPKCEDQEGCKWVVGKGCQSTESPPKKLAAKPTKKPRKKLAKKPAAKKKKKSLEELLEELKKLFQTSVGSVDDKRDWDAFYKALNALYRDKFDLKENETYYIASASKERNRPMQADVISSNEDTTAFPVFEDLKVPYKKRKDARAAAQAFVEMYGPDEDSYEKKRFSTGSPALEIARYISFLSRN